MKTPLHFDGHGVNDANGERIFKLSTKQWREDGKGLEPEFIQLSNLLASAPELLEILKTVTDSLYEAIELTDENRNYSRRWTEDWQKARQAIAKAQSLDY